MPKVVLYHAECNDGIMAAAIVSYFERDPTITYHPVNYKVPLPEIPVGAEVIMVDFCHDDLGMMLTVLDNCQHLTVIDHHAKAVPILEALLQANEDKITVSYHSHESGASATWKHYTQNPMPKVVELVRNHDLHIHKTIEDDYFFYGVMTKEQTIAYWTSLILDQKEVNNLILAGRSVHAFISSTAIPQITSKARFASLQGYVVPVVNCNRVLQSLVLDSMLPIHMVAIAYEDWGDGKRKWSVRSAPQTNGAAQRIAEEFFGSGHENAAGFLSDVDFQLPYISTDTA